MGQDITQRREKQPAKKRAVENEKGTSKTTTGVSFLGPPWEPKLARFLVGCECAVMLQWLGTLGT